LIAFALLATVFYHFFYKEPDYKPVLELTAKEKIIITSSARDSLQQLYALTVNSLGNRFDTARSHADSLHYQLDKRISEFYKLREEIAAILKDGRPTADLSRAAQKIKELQEKVGALRFVNRDVEAENRRLVKLIDQLKTGEAGENSPPVPAAATRPATPLAKKTNPHKNFQVTEVKFVGVKMHGDKEEGTSEAAATEKFAGSFVLRNDLSFNGAEIMMVILQPDGKVFQGSAWDAGSFETAQGKKIYSRKLTTDYKKGESKRLSFTVPAADLPKGNYQLQVFHNGQMVARVNKSLF
jgi:hypothetical protein